MFRKILIGALITSTLFLSPVDVSAERRQIQASGEYVFGDSEESPAVAKERARVYALKNASQQAGVFVESIVRVKNMVLTEDEIRTISANVLEVVGEPQFKNEVTADGKGFIIRCHIVAIVDDDNINAKLMKDRQSLDEAVRMNREYENRIRDLTDEIERLKRERANATTESEIKRIDAQIKQNDLGFKAMQYVDLGNTACDDENYSMAIEYLTKAIELNPNLASAYYSRGWTYYRQGNLTQANMDYNKAIELNPDLAGSYYNRGSAYRRTVNMNQEIDYYTRIIDLKPHDASAYYRRGVEYEYRREYDQAIQDFTKAIELNPKYSEAYNHRGWRYYKQGNFTKAIADYTKAIKSNPRYAAAYVNRGLAYEILGNKSQAIADYKRALELEPKNTYAQQYLNLLQSR